MEMLDLAAHDPEEYEGKGIAVGGCLYEVGAPVGSGASKFVHLLKNCRSGLHMSVLAIFRSEEEGRDGLPREIAAKVTSDMLGFPTVPNIMEIQLPGTVAFVQDYIGPYELQPDPRLLSAEPLQRQQRWQESIEVITEVLAANPEHTVALNNIAFALAHLDRPGEAVDVMAKVLEIEPNYLPYLHSYISYCADAELPSEALGGYLALHERYPHDRTFEGLTDRIARHAAFMNNQALELLRDDRPGEAVETIHECVRCYQRLVEFDQETYFVELAESLINLGFIEVRTASPVAAVSPLTSALGICGTYGRQDLFDIAGRNLRHAFTLDPDGVAAEFQQVNGRPLPDWVRRPADDGTGTTRG